MEIRNTSRQRSREQRGAPQPGGGTPYLVPSTLYPGRGTSQPSSIESLRLLPLLPSILFALISLLFSTAAATSAESTANSAVETGKEALSGVARFPWYDKSQDDVRQLHVVPRDTADSGNRGSTWTKQNNSTATPTNFPRFSLLGGALQWVGLTTLIILLGVLAFLIAKAFLKDEVTETTAARKVVESHRDAARVEALPFTVRKPTGDFLSEARRLYEAGDYSEAMIYLFSYELVQLDRQHLIRLAKGKTNRQYLRELRQRPPLQAILEPTMIAFEDAFFGRKTLSRERFENCWQRVEEFSRQLDHYERAAA
jgi:Domain of unknown function (DUF4129)